MTGVNIIQISKSFNAQINEKEKDDAKGYGNNSLNYKRDLIVTIGKFAIHLFYYIPSLRNSSRASRAFFENLVGVLT